jgi:hypothetical protein
MPKFKVGDLVTGKKTDRNSQASIFIKDIANNMYYINKYSTYSGRLVPEWQQKVAGYPIEDLDKKCILTRLFNYNILWNQLNA